VGRESEDAISTIRLRQPGHIQVHVEDILRVESAVGDDRKKGTWIYLRDNSERRYCLETANKVREMIDEARSKEEIQLDVLAIGLLLKAVDKATDKSVHGRLRFTESADTLTVTAGGFQMECLQGRDRSKYEYAEQQLSRYALVTVESKGVYRLHERGWQMAEFFLAR
jgi:hypothetical protein